MGEWGHNKTTVSMLPKLTVLFYDLCPLYLVENEVPGSALLSFLEVPQPSASSMFCFTSKSSSSLIFKKINRFQNGDPSPSAPDLLRGFSLFGNVR